MKRISNLFRSNKGPEKKTPQVEWKKGQTPKDIEQAMAETGQEGTLSAVNQGSSPPKSPAMERPKVPPRPAPKAKATATEADQGQKEPLTAADQISSTPPKSPARGPAPEVPPWPPRKAKATPKEPSRHDVIVTDALMKHVQDDNFNKRLALYINRIVSAHERGMNTVANTALERLKQLINNYMDSSNINPTKAELAAKYVYDLLTDLKKENIIASNDEILNDPRILNARLNQLNKILATHTPLDGTPSPKPVQPQTHDETAAMKNRQLDKLEQQLLQIKANNDDIINPKIHRLEQAIQKYGNPGDEFKENFNAVKSLREKQRPDKEINGALDQLLHEMRLHKEMVRNDLQLLESGLGKLKIIDQFIANNPNQVSQQFLNRYKLITENFIEIAEYGKIDQDVHADILEIVDLIDDIMKRFNLKDPKNRASSEQSQKPAWASHQQSRESSSEDDEEEKKNSYDI